MVTPDLYRVLTNCMADVVTCHGRNGLVLFVSPVAETMFGTKIHDLMGRGLYDLIHLGDRPVFLSALSDCALSGKIRSAEFRVRRDQTAGDCAMDFIWVEMRCSLLDQDFDPGHDASDRQVVAVMREITERKVRDSELAEAHGELDRANAAKSRFLATMSHELRTPLNAIIGFSEMLTKKDALMIDAGRQCEYAKLINETGRHLLAVVNGILDMSKIENDSFEIAPEAFAECLRICPSHGSRLYSFARSCHRGEVLRARTQPGSQKSATIGGHGVLGLPAKELRRCRIAAPRLRPIAGGRSPGHQ